MTHGHKAMVALAALLAPSLAHAQSRSTDAAVLRYAARRDLTMVPVGKDLHGNDVYVAVPVLLLDGRYRGAVDILGNGSGDPVIFDCAQPRLRLAGDRYWLALADDSIGAAVRAVVCRATNVTNR